MVVLAASLQSPDKSGCEAAAAKADPESDITAFLVWCWLRSLVCGLRRAHSFLQGRYDLSAVVSGQSRSTVTAEAAAYLAAIQTGATGRWPRRPVGLLMAYSTATAGFLLGRPSQQRKSDNA